MNDHVADSATREEKQSHVEMGKRIAERAEQAVLKLVELVVKGEAAGMMDRNESQHLQNDLMEKYYGLLSIHCRLTAVAQRNDCDVPAGGEVQTRGGPGR